MYRVNFLGGTRVFAGLVVASISISGLAGAQSLEPTWVLSSDGSWQPDNISLGAEGVEVFSEHGFYQNARVLLSSHDTNPPTPVWSDDEFVWNQVRRVASSSRASVHVSLHQEYIDATLTWRQPVLRKYSSGSSEADWVFTSDILISNSDDTHVFVSEDGTRVVSAVFSVAANATVFDVFDSESSVPVYSHVVDTWGPGDGVVVSADGSRAAVRSGVALKVIDLDSGAVLFTTYYFGSSFAGGLDLSGDAAVIAIASGGLMDVFSWNGASYVSSTSFPLPAGGYTPAVAVSEDGSTVAHATNFFSAPGSVHLQMLNAGDQTVVLDHHVSAGGTAANVASALCLSADGEVAALGLWGDEHGTVPEVLLFDRDQVGVVASCDLPGSVMDMELSPDGGKVAVAAKGSHATVFGNGGGLYLFDTEEADFDLYGAPTVGSTVALGQQLEPGGFGRVIASPMLSSEPRVFDGVGTLYLDESQFSFLPGLAQAGGDGMVWTPHFIANDSALVGTTMYFQGIGLRPRKLSDDVVEMTVLP